MLSCNVFCVRFWLHRFDSQRCGIPGFILINQNLLLRRYLPGNKRLGSSATAAAAATASQSVSQPASQPASQPDSQPANPEAPKPAPKPENPRSLDACVRQWASAGSAKRLQSAAALRQASAGARVPAGRVGSSSGTPFLSSVH